MVSVFISYSHDSAEHKNWVKELSNQLSNRGISVIYDESDLKPGYEIDKFMRESIDSADFVLVIGTPHYRNKAEVEMQGYTSVEYQYIRQATKELRDAGRQEEAEKKFIAILRAGDEKDSIPQHIRGKFWVDLRDTNPQYDEYLEKLCKQLLSDDKVDSDTHEVLIPYDESVVHEHPLIETLKNYTQLVESGQNNEGRWYIKRYDPIDKKEVTLLFQNPQEYDKKYAELYGRLPGYVTYFSAQKARLNIPDELAELLKSAQTDYNATYIAYSSGATQTPAIRSDMREKYETLDYVMRDISSQIKNDPTIKLTTADYDSLNLRDENEQ